MYQNIEKLDRNTDLSHMYELLHVRAGQMMMISEVLVKYLRDRLNRKVRLTRLKVKVVVKVMFKVKVKVIVSFSSGRVVTRRSLLCPLLREIF